MIYLICYVWKSTEGNHTGMSYMCDLLLRHYPGKFCVLKHYQRSSVNICSIRRFNRMLTRWLEKLEEIRIVILFLLLLRRIKDNDIIFLTEYLHPRINQLYLSKLLKRNKPTIKVYGLAHLTPTMLRDLMVDEKCMSNWDNSIDYFVTLGSNLTKYLESLGVSSQKIITTRHYVDMQYYKNIVCENPSFQVIVIGSMQRKYSQLEEIVRLCPNIKFIICAGREKLIQFANYSNVTILGYISEAELAQKMAQSSVSLSVMEDTVGSNVIVTSMAMGLCQVVSDVGAIHDYCCDDNAYFCSETKEFVDALQYLYSHREDLYQKRINAQLAAKEYSIQRFVKDLSL